MPDLYKMQEEIEELEKYADYEGTELGEMCQSLVRIAHYPDYISEELRQTVAQEIVDTLAVFHEQATLVEVEVKSSYMSTELVWNS